MHNLEITFVKSIHITQFINKTISYFSSYIILKMTWAFLCKTLHNFLFLKCYRSNIYKKQNKHNLAYLLLLHSFYISTFDFTLLFVFNSLRCFVEASYSWLTITSYHFHPKPQLHLNKENHNPFFFFFFFLIQSQGQRKTITPYFLY